MNLLYIIRKVPLSDLRIVFTPDHYLEADGEDRFEEELERVLQKARFDLTPAAALKDQLVQALSAMNYQVMSSAGISQEEIHQWTAGPDVTAFRNPSGELVCVILNRGSAPKRCVIRLRGETAAVTIAGEAIATLRIA